MRWSRARNESRAGKRSKAQPLERPPRPGQLIIDLVLLGIVAAVGVQLARDSASQPPDARRPT